MHYLRAPLVLVATTFLAAVLATPMNGYIRRDSLSISSNATILTILADAFNETNTVVQNVNNEIQGISSTPDESEIQKFFDIFSNAIVDVDGVLVLMLTLDEDDSGRFANGDFIPLLASLNNTAKSLAQQRNVIADFDSFQQSILAGSLEDILLDFDVIPSVIAGGLIASDEIAQQLQNITDGVSKSFSDTAFALGFTQ